jgi:hypothetical protein
MARDLAHQLRFLGAIPQIGHVEYGFRIEDKDKNTRLIVLEIESGFFQKNQLMFQEGPDLCYQKMLLDLTNESVDSPLGARVAVTASDIAYYRELHPTTKLRKAARKEKKN